MKVYEQLKLQHDVEVPWEVWRFFGRTAKKFVLAGNAASPGEDFGNIDELRAAVAWYVDQLGGKVKWMD